MADGGDFLSSAESTAVSEELFSNPEICYIDASSTPSVAKTSAVTRQLFTGESTARDPLGDISNRRTLPKEADIAPHSAGGSVSMRLPSAAKDDL